MCVWERGSFCCMCFVKKRVKLKVVRRACEIVCVWVCVLNIRCVCWEWKLSISRFLSVCVWIRILYTAAQYGLSEFQIIKIMSYYNFVTNMILIQLIVCRFLFQNVFKSCSRLLLFFFYCSILQYFRLSRHTALPKYQRTDILHTAASDSQWGVAR